MRLLDLRKKLKSEFKELGIEEVDADFIISEVLEVKRTELALISDVNDEKTEEILNYAELRKQNIPVDKLFKKAYFYGLEFEVNENVLSPRQDSELLVEKALEYIKANNFKSVLDLCTGSGCLAISIKKNIDVEVSASDISSKALAVAKRNAKKNDVEINFIKSDMFTEIDSTFDLIVSNPPYIPTNELKELDKEVILNDPKLALDGGEMGLKFYNIIHNNLRKYLNENGILILEIGEDQKILITSLFNDFELLESLQDLGGNDRVLIFKK